MWLVARLPESLWVLTVDPMEVPLLPDALCSGEEKKITIKVRNRFSSLLLPLLLVMTWDIWGDLVLNAFRSSNYRQTAVWSDCSDNEQLPSESLYMFIDYIHASSVRLLELSVWPHISRTRNYVLWNVWPITFFQVSVAIPESNIPPSHGGRTVLGMKCFRLFKH